MSVSLPPGPGGNALFSTLRYLRAPEGWLLAEAKKWGDPFTMPSLAGPLVVTGSPEGVRAIFTADPETFAPFSVDAMTPILGRGSILLQHGAEHRRARRLMMPPFHSGRMRAYGETIFAATRRHWAKTPGGQKFPIEDVFRAISIDVIIRTVFGVDNNERVEKTRDEIRGAIESFGPLIAMFQALRKNFGGLGPWAKFQRRLSDVHRLLREEIHARQNKAGGEDILSLLVAARDEDGNPMEEQEIIEQLFTMVIAGHETTATALAWAVDEVYRQPELLARLRAELTPIAGDAEKMASAPLLEAVCSETLRLHPLIPIVSRRLLKPFSLGGFDLPEGTGVGACLLVAHRNPARYPDGDSFKPERFLDGNKHSPHEYFPFGGGAKRCLGAALASYEMKLVLGTLLLEAKLSPASQKNAQPAARQATVGPKGGVPVIRAT